VPAVIAEGVDIPPEITTRRDRLVESRCAISVAAARRPDIAAIGARRLAGRGLGGDARPADRAGAQGWL
jgi:hypothetical protein